MTAPLYTQYRDNVPVNIGDELIYSLYASFYLPVTNGGRTWLRLLTPVQAGGPLVIGESWVLPNNQSRQYDDKSYGLLRGLTGMSAQFGVTSHPQVWWQPNPDVVPYLDEYGNVFYESDDLGSIMGGWSGKMGMPQGGHFFDQDELNETLTGATLHTSGGSYAFTTGWLDGGYYDGETGAETIATNVEYQNFTEPSPYQGITN